MWIQIRTKKMMNRESLNASCGKIKYATDILLSGSDFFKQLL